MLKITIPGREFWDDKKEEFVNTKDVALQLEHSLVSLSKWEAKWHKPFLSQGQQTLEETLDYIRCMTLTQNVNPLIYSSLSDEVINQVYDYIDNPMTATWFSKEENRRWNQEVITAEILYYRMIAYNIPFECQKWHLNRLLTLMRVCDVKNAPDQKLSKKQIAKKNAALNAARRKALKSKG